MSNNCITTLDIFGAESFERELGPPSREDLVKLAINLYYLHWPVSLAIIATAEQDLLLIVKLTLIVAEKRVSGLEEMFLLLKKLPLRLLVRHIESFDGVCEALVNVSAKDVDFIT